MVEIKKLEKDGVNIISVIGEVDASSSIKLDSAIQDVIESGSKKIMVDCSALEYISSAGLGVFMSYLEDMKKKKIKFAVAGLNEKVHHVFEILGLDELLKIFGTKEEGLKYLL